MSHPCPNQSCQDNVRGECFAGGCRMNPEPMTDNDEGVNEDDE